MSLLMDALNTSSAAKKECGTQHSDEALAHAGNHSLEPGHPSLALGEIEDPSGDRVSATATSKAEKAASEENASRVSRDDSFHSAPPITPLPPPRRARVPHLLLLGIAALLLIATAAGLFLYLQGGALKTTASAISSAPIESPVTPPLSSAPAPLPPEPDHAAWEPPLAPPEEEPSGEAIVVSRRTSPAPGVAAASAYAAYRRGDFDTARRGYDALVTEDPHSRNGLLGLAAIASHTGHVADARMNYDRLLERDPNDPLARVGVLNLEAPLDPRAQESRLKSLIARHPDLAPLHVALGHLFARHERWSEAHAAYTKGVALEKSDATSPGQRSPDLAFNLAVVSEHLGRYGVARAHYQAALESARVRHASFDPSIAQSRIDALEVREHE